MFYDFIRARDIKYDGFCQMFYDFMYKDEKIQGEIVKALTKFVP